MTKGFVKGKGALDVERMYVLQGDLDVEYDTYLWAINGLTVTPAAGPRFQRNGVLVSRSDCESHGWPAGILFLGSHC